MITNSQLQCSQHVQIGQNRGDLFVPILTFSGTNKLSDTAKDGTIDTLSLIIMRFLQLVKECKNVIGYIARFSNKVQRP
jgi:hypothetical protein